MISYVWLKLLRTDVVIPIHYDVWTNFKADPKEIELLYNYKKDVLDYKFHPFIWDVGGKYVYPTDKAKRQYHYRRGFEDCFEEEPNVPYRSVFIRRGNEYVERNC